MNQDLNSPVPGEGVVLSQVMPAPAEGRFLPTEGLEAEEEQSQKTRLFTGSGTPYLAVPGLKRLDAVRLGLRTAPLFEDRQYPVSAHGHYEVMREPLFMLGEGPDGGAVLLRSRISNHGLWQRGIKVYVTGEWEEPAAFASQAVKPEPGVAKRRSRRK